MVKEVIHEGNYYKFLGAHGRVLFWVEDDSIYDGFGNEFHDDLEKVFKEALKDGTN